MKGLSRRTFMKASPAAVVGAGVAAKGIAQAVVQEQAWGGGMLSTPGVNYGLQSLVKEAHAAEFDPIKHVGYVLKHLRQERAEIHERHARDCSQRNVQLEAARIDGMKSLAPHTRIRMIERAQHQLELERSLSYVEMQVRNLKKDYPVAGFLVDQFLGEDK